MTNLILRQRLASHMTIAARLLFWPLLVLALTAAALEFGVWKTEETFQGPFVKEAGETRFAYQLPIGRALQFKCCLQPRDDNGNSDQSDLRLWIDGREMGPAHTMHETIRTVGATGFSHWGDTVLFRLPDGADAAAARATVRYSLRPVQGGTFLLIFTSALLCWLAYPRAIQTTGNILGPSAVRAPLVSFRVAGYAVLAVAFFYIAFTIYAWLSGWALPTSALIRLSPTTEWFARHEPQLGYVLLTWAALGALVHWIARFFNAPAPQRDEIMLIRFFTWWGAPITACALIFSMSAMWAGIVRAGDIHWASIGGLVAFSDAAGYLAGAHDQAKDGVWNTISVRRPIAAAFRSVLMFFGGFSYSNMLLLQAVLTAIASCFATVAVARWRGLWAGVGFFALAYIYTRGFVPTSLTEPLSLIWALFSVPFLIEAFKGSITHAFIALAAITLALMTRMGSMFTIPALIIWIVWHFGDSFKARAAVLAASLAVVLGVLLASSSLQALYGNNQTLAGSNFSYVLCGLTIGTDWYGCLAKIKDAGGTLPGSEQELTALMNSMAFQNFSLHPNIFLERLLVLFLEFLDQLPMVLLRGYDFADPPDSLLRNFLITSCIIGLLYMGFRSFSRSGAVFWGLILTSISASAALVFNDDGKRVLAATFPLLWLFFSYGLSTSYLQKNIDNSKTPPTSLAPRTGLLVLGAAALLFGIIPWLAHRISPAAELLAGSPIKADEHIVFGGRRMSGILIVPDGEKLRDDLPTLHISSFMEFVKRANIEQYQGLLHPVMPTLPFGFVYAPRLGRGESYYQYIVSPEVLERGNVRAWRLQTEEWHRKPAWGPYWFKVTRAEALN